MDLAYSLLKIISMIATGLFGALGLLTKYRDDQGRITKWGKVALGGILISSGISLGLYTLETSKAKAAAIQAQAEAKATAEKLETILVNAQTTAEQQKRSLEETNILKAGLEKTLEQQGLNLKRSDYIAKEMKNSLAAEQAVLSGNQRILGGVTATLLKQGELLSLNTSTLNQVSRGLYPIKDVRIGYRIRVPTEHIQLKNYINRFDRELARLLPQLTFNSRIPWITGGSSEDGNTYQEFGFSETAPLAPDKTREKLAYTILGYSDVELQFFKKPIAPGDHLQVSGNWRSYSKPDLKLEVTGGLSPKNSDGGHDIEYEIKTKRFTLLALDLTANPKYWESSGNIVGIPDLLGAQMFVFFPSTMVSGDPAIDQFLPEIRRGFQLETLTISISTGRVLWFRGADLQKHIAKDGHLIYSFIFPNTMNELRKLERDSQ